MRFDFFVLVALLSTPAQADKVNVFAAASLGPALEDVASGWEGATGHDVVISYAGSGALAQQIINGAPADIFISASSDWMAAVEAEGLVRSGPLTLLGNDLVLVATGTAPAVEIAPGLDLLALLGDGRLAMGLVTSVPAGQYGKAALENLGLWDSVADRVAQVDNVRAALALVVRGEAPLGIVYATDAKAEPGVSVIGVFPADSHPPIRYPVALLSQTDAGRAFYDLLQSPETASIFASHGFLLPNSQE